MADSPGTKVSSSPQMQGFLAAAEAMVSLGEVVAEMTGSVLTIDRKSPHQLAGKAKLRIAGKPWTLKAFAKAEDPNITLELSRRCTPSWTGDMMRFQLTMELYRLRMENSALPERATGIPRTTLENGLVRISSVMPVSDTKEAPVILRKLVGTAEAAWNALTEE